MRGWRRFKTVMLLGVAFGAAAFALLAYAWPTITE